MKNLKLATFNALLGAAFIGFSAQPALSASDGILGASSTGTADVSLTIEEVVRITDMDDFAFGSYSGSGALEADDNICVYHNGDGNYKVTITDDTTGSPSGFAVEGPLGDIPMEVKWNDAPSTTGSTLITYGVALAATNANTESENCATGGLSANMQVDLAEANIQAAPAGAYSSTIVVLVEPD